MSNISNLAGRSGRARTCDPRFWRPVLYQLSYTPSALKVLAFSERRTEQTLIPHRPATALLPNLVSALTYRRAQRPVNRRRRLALPVRHQVAVNVIVIAIDECPRRSWTILGCRFDASIWLA
jgi:hypothetical protein